MVLTWRARRARSFPWLAPELPTTNGACEKVGQLDEGWKVPRCIDRRLSALRIFRRSLCSQMDEPKSKVSTSRNSAVLKSPSILIYKLFELILLSIPEFVAAFVVVRKRVPLVLVGKSFGGP